MKEREKGHAALLNAPFVDGSLTWGGRKVSELADASGQTPFFAYSLTAIDQRIEHLRAHLPNRLRLYYAVKANPMPEIIRHMVHRLDGLDIASAGELALAMGNEAYPGNVSFAGPGKQQSELIAAIEAGVNVSLESVGEMRRFAALSNSIGKTTGVTLRINPPFELARSGMKMGGRASPFGVDVEQAPALLKELAALGLPLQGFHIYAGSQTLDARAIAEAVHHSVALVVELADKSPLHVSRINLGGGFGIPYFPGQMPLDLGELTEPFAEAIAIADRALGQPELILELGRYLVGEAGIYVCRVIDVKESRGRRFVVMDGGMNHHLAATGNLGQVIRRNYPVVAVEQRPDSMEATVVGPLCTPLDILGDRIRIAQVEVGSLIAVLQSGAYARTASPEGFLSHPPARELVI